MINAPTIPKAKEKSFYYCSIFAYIVYILKSNVTRKVPQGIFYLIILTPLTTWHKETIMEI